MSFDRPLWVAGSEKRFAEFLASLNNKDVIAMVSHKADLDGIVSAKVISSVVEPNALKLVDYAELNERLIEELRKEKATKVIFSDLNFKKKEEFIRLESFARVLIIDHHQFQEDFNSEKTVFMNAQGMCAAYLAYTLFSKAQDLKQLGWAVACASLSDWAWMKNQGWLRGVFQQYDENFVGTEEGVRQGTFWDFQGKLSLALKYYEDRILEFYHAFPRQFGELGDLADHIDEVQKEVDHALNAFEKEKKEIHGRWFWKIDSVFDIGSILINMKSHEHPEKTFIVFSEDSGTAHVSFRRQDCGEDVSLLARKLVDGFKGGDGGGHKAAAGCLLPARFLPEFLRRLEKL